MAGYEYIRLRFDWGDLKELNGLGSVGWHVVAINESDPDYRDEVWALLMREVPNA